MTFSYWLGRSVRRHPLAAAAVVALAVGLLVFTLHDRGDDIDGAQKPRVEYAAPPLRDPADTPARRERRRQERSDADLAATLERMKH